MITCIFIDGKFRADLSDMALLPKTIDFRTTKEGLSVTIPKETSILQPIRLHFITESYGNYFLENTISVGENSQLSIIEEYTSRNVENYSIETKTSLYADQNSRIHYFKIQKDHPTAEHAATLSIQQKKESYIQTFFADLGGLKTNENIYVNLAESHSECFLYGLYYLNQDNQQLRHRIFVDHAAKQGKSNMLYKGILDKKSLASFHGKVYVQPNALHITANQGNHNLLLSNLAEVQSKPELEVYADDIKCFHGATVGQLDTNALFYLKSRGIPQKEAQQLLTKGFANEMIDKIEYPLIRDYIAEQVDSYAL